MSGSRKSARLLGLTKKSDDEAPPQQKGVSVRELFYSARRKRTNFVLPDPAKFPDPSVYDDNDLTGLEEYLIEAQTTYGFAADGKLSYDSIAWTAARNVPEFKALISGRSAVAPVVPANPTTPREHALTVLILAYNKYASHYTSFRRPQ